jgi:D-arabinose 1-dehydrogenase-like Zn-dependent alcohol dehydrogenase
MLALFISGGVMAKMRAVQVTKRGGPFEQVELDIPEPTPHQVRIKVRACGICHSDLFTKEGLYPGVTYPRIPGHEVAGVIDSVGEAVTVWKRGQHVGVGWYGGHCGVCRQCRWGDFINCRNINITGVLSDGGYAQYMLASQHALTLIPPNLDFEMAAPLMCAGITTYNALRNSGARPGDLVAIDGIGGLGHLAIQFAAKMGYKVIAISRGKEKEAFAKQLGAWGYIDSEHHDPAKELMIEGGAKVILATAPNEQVISKLTEGLGVNGVLLIVAASPEPLSVSPITLIRDRRRIQGWPSGAAADSEDTLNFAVLTGVRPMIELFKLEDVQAAFDKMMKGQIRFRAVLKIS